MLRTGSIYLKPLIDAAEVGENKKEIRSLVSLEEKNSTQLTRVLSERGFPSTGLFSSQKNRDMKNDLRLDVLDDKQNQRCNQTHLLWYIQRQGSRAIVCPSLMSSKQMTHSPFSSVRTSSAKTQVITFSTCYRDNKTRL
jgi:hypothetical protein